MGTLNETEATQLAIFLIITIFNTVDGILMPLSIEAERILNNFTLRISYS